MILPNRAVRIGCVGLLLCTATWADIVFRSAVDNSRTNNVLFNGNNDTAGAGTTLEGHIENLGTSVSITSDGDVTVDVSSGGQAAISALDSAFSVADIYLTTGGVYQKIVFALSGSGMGASSQVPFTITVTEGDGFIQSAQFTTGRGNTFYTIYATSGQGIQNVNLLTDGGYEFGTLKQVRIGVPDGGTTFILLAGALVGLGVLSRNFST